MNRYLVTGLAAILTGAVAAVAMPRDLIVVAQSQPEVVTVTGGGTLTLASSGTVGQSGAITFGGDIVFDDGPQQTDVPPNSAVLPQVAQILSTVGNGPAGAKRRDAAEDKLVEMGPDAVDGLQSQLNLHKGAARDALVVAIFRLQNAPLSPRDSISGWIRKQANVDPAAVNAHHIVAEELRQMFPHHLFYAAESKPAANGKSDFPRTVIALAADGKVQSVGDDAAMAKFFKVELPEKMETGDQRRAASAAAILALARGPAESGEMTSDGKVTGSTLIGTAQISGAKSRKVTVTVKLGADGRVESLASAVQALKPSEPKPHPPTREATTEESPDRASSQPATRMRMHLPIRRRLPQFAPPAGQPMD